MNFWEWLHKQLSVDLPLPQCGVAVHLDGMLVNVTKANLAFADALHQSWLMGLWSPDVEFMVYCLEWTT